MRTTFFSLTIFLTLPFISSGTNKQDRNVATKESNQVTNIVNCNFSSRINESESLDVRFQGPYAASNKSLQEFTQRINESKSLDVRFQGQYAASNKSLQEFIKRIKESESLDVRFQGDYAASDCSLY